MTARTWHIGDPFIRGGTHGTQRVVHSFLDAPPEGGHSIDLEGVDLLVREGVPACVFIGVEFGLGGRRRAGHGEIVDLVALAAVANVVVDVFEGGIGFTHGRGPFKRGEWGWIQGTLAGLPGRVLRLIWDVLVLGPLLRKGSHSRKMYLSAMSVASLVVRKAGPASSDPMLIQGMPSFEAVR